MHSGMTPPAPTSSPVYADVPPPGPPPTSHSSSANIVDEIAAWLNEFKPKEAVRSRGEPDGPVATSQSIDPSSTPSQGRQLPNWFYSDIGTITNNTAGPHMASSSSSAANTPTLPIDTAAWSQQHQHPQQEDQKQHLQHPQDRTAPWLEWRFETLSISPAGNYSLSPSPQSMDRLEQTSGAIRSAATAAAAAAATTSLVDRPHYFDLFSTQQEPPAISSSSLQPGVLAPAMRQELRMQKKYQQPWRRSKTHPAALRAHANARRQLQMAAALQQITPALHSSSSNSTDGTGVAIGTTATTAATPSMTAAYAKREIVLPHDILSHIFASFDSRANAQQYYDKTMPSDLIACSRVNMAWRIAALEKIWQTILLPDPLDLSCRKLLYLLASSHSAAKILERSYDLTDLIKRVEIDLVQAVAVATSHGSGLGPGLGPITHGSFGGGDQAVFCRTIGTLLRLISPFRTLSIQLPQEIDMNEADALTKTWSLPLFHAIVDGVSDARIQELDMPSAMYCTVKTFPGMLSLISTLKDLRTLILGYSSRDWPLLRAILGLPLLENLCIFDSCWSNQIWIYLLGTLGTRLRGLTILQGKRPLEGLVLQEGIAPFCRNLTSLSIPFIQLFQGPSPVLVDEDLIPMIKACHGLQVINLSGQRLLGDGTLEALAELWGLELLDIRGCQHMTGKDIKRLRWQSIQRVRVFGCDSLSTEFMSLVAMVWQSQRAATGQLTSPSPSSAEAVSSSVTTNIHAPLLDAAGSTNATSSLEFPPHAGDSRSNSPDGRSSSTPSPVLPNTITNNDDNNNTSNPPYLGLAVLDFKTDLEDPVEMGWVRQREDEPPLDVDEDHFFAEWYR